MPLPNGMLIDDEDPNCQDVQIEELEDCTILRWKDQNGVQYERRVPARHTMTFRPQVSTHRRPIKSRRQLAEEAAAEAERILSQNQGTVQLDPTEAVIEPQELEEGEKETTESENDKEEQKISQWPEDRLGMPRFNGTLKDWENWVTVAAARDLELLQQAKLRPVLPVLEAAFRNQPDYPSKTGLVTPETQKNISNDEEKSMESAEETRLFEPETLE